MRQRRPQASRSEARDAARRRMLVTAGPYNLVDGDIAEIAGRPVEPWSPDAAYARLQRVAPNVPVPIPPDAVLLPGDSNDAWLLGDAVLRVCWRGDRERLLREARLAANLPASLPYSRVREYGSDGTFSWILTDRVVGTTLASLWSEAGPDRLHGLITQLAGLLRQLHDWTPPSDIAHLFDDTHTDEPEDALTIVGRSMVPLPVARLQRLIRFARSLPFIDAALLDAADERVLDLSDAIPANDGPRVLIHGDASPGNVIVHDGTITALLDYEWARIGPRDLELVPLLHWLELHGPPQRLPPLMEWMRDAYPEMFDVPAIDRRLWLYQLAFNIRGLIVWPPDRMETGLHANHPVRRLRVLVDRPMHHIA